MRLTAQWKAWKVNGWVKTLADRVRARWRAEWPGVPCPATVRAAPYEAAGVKSVRLIASEGGRVVRLRWWEDEQQEFTVTGGWG